MEIDFYRKIDEIIKKDPRYKSDAYAFVMEALFYTQKKLKRKTHVSGQELAKGIKQYCFEKFGPMSKTVLEHWGIKETRDFGNVVFNMIELGMMSKAEDDSIEDFTDVYSFKEAFADEYKTQVDKELKKEQSKFKDNNQ